MMSELPLNQSEDSLNADNDVDSNGDGIGDVCRDFLRNVCRRGNACRFRHPDPSEAEELGKKIEYIFCHDYQNRECRRQNCRFLHCTKQEEEVYRSTGKLPQHVLDKMAQNKASEVAQSMANVPICKDNLKGECRRGPGRCKFRHVSQSDYDMETSRNNHSSGHHSSRFDGHSVRNQMHNSFNSNAFNDTFSPPEPKRRAYDTSAAFNTNSFATFTADRAGGLNLTGLNSAANMSDFDYKPDFGPSGAMHTNAGAGLAPNTIYSSARYLEEENAALRRRIDELKKQVADLMATNEFLLEQNAQLRTIGKANQAQTQSTTVSSLAPPPLPQMSNDFTELGRTELSVGVVVPVSLGSIQAQTMTGLPVSSIASMSLPTSVSLSNSAPLVSYPIITTQSMRPSIMTHSLGH